jgi:hypothetical protein
MAGGVGATSSRCHKNAARTYKFTRSWITNVDYGTQEGISHDEPRRCLCCVEAWHHARNMQYENVALGVEGRNRADRL